MYALAGQRVEVDRQGSHQGLALTGTHLGDLAFVQRGAADQLDIEVAHAHDALACLADHGEGFGHQRIEGLALGYALLEFLGLGAQLLVAQGGNLGFERIGGHHDLA